VLADRVEDDVVTLVVLGEVVLCVVDRLLGAERANELEVLASGNRGHARAQMVG
jgi:hypothetical protein